MQPRLAVGYAHTCFLSASGVVRCWGSVEASGGGIGTLEPAPDGLGTPGLVSLPADPVEVIAAGAFHTCAVTRAGSIWCWGGGRFGQLGDGAGQSHMAPVMVQAPPGVRFTAVSLESTATCALDESGSVWCWGGESPNLLSEGSRAVRPLPAPIAAAVPFVAIASGNAHTCALTEDGRAWCWGENYFGQLGTGTKRDSESPVAVVMPPGVTFSALAAGRDHTCALATDGQAWCWGSHEALTAQVPDDYAPFDSSRTPTAVPMPSGTTFTEISAGEVHTCALATDGRAWCWGANWVSQLGDGTHVNRSVPTLVSMPPGTVFASVIAGADHTCAIDVVGGVWCWGSNDFGELGTEESAPEPFPIEVPLEVTPSRTP